MLPSVEDDKDLRRLFAVHVSRVLATHIPLQELHLKMFWSGISTTSITLKTSQCLSF